MSSGVFRAYPDDDVDTADLGSWGRQRIAADHHIPTRNVLQFARRFAEEVMVVRCVGVEIGATRFDHDFAQQTRIRELVKRVVNRRKRDPDRRTCRLGVELLGGDVALSIFEQEARKGKALATRIKPTSLTPIV